MEWREAVEVSFHPMHLYAFFLLSLYKNSLQFKNETFTHSKVVIEDMFGQEFIRSVLKTLGLIQEPRVKLIPWNDSHSGNFDADEEAYTLLLDGKRTNISFAIEEGDAKAPDYEKVTMHIPRYVEQYGVDIKPSALEKFEQAKER